MRQQTTLAHYRCGISIAHRARYRRLSMTEKVLVVDDNPQVLALASRWLQSEGYEALTATCFADARVQIQVFEPAIVIADVRLGDFNGIQLGMLAQTIRSDVRVIIMSGFGDEVLERDVAGFGGRFLQKPFGARALLAAVGPRPVHSRGPNPPVKSPRHAITASEDRRAQRRRR